MDTARRNAPTRLHRVLLAGGGDLGHGGLAQIDPALVREPHEVHEDVRHLLGQPRVQRFLVGKVPRRVRRQPLQELGEFPYLADQREHHGLGVLELLPVSLGDEGTSGIPDLDQVRHTSEYAAPTRVRAGVGLESPL